MIHIVFVCNPVRKSPAPTAAPPRQISFVTLMGMRMAQAHVKKSGASDDRTDDHRRIVRPLVEEQSIIKLQVKQYLRGILLCVSCVDASTIATSKPRLLQVVASPHLLTPLKSPKRMR